MGRGGIVPSLRTSIRDASMTGDVYLVTERMMLRRITATDVDDLMALDADPQVMKHVDPFAITPHGRAGLRDFICNRRLPQFLAYYDLYSDRGFWAAIDRHDGRFLGWFHLIPRPEAPNEAVLGYRLHSFAWGRGLATEGARALVDRAFASGAVRVVAETLARHRASIRVMEKLGMKFIRESDFRGLPNVEYCIDSPLKVASS